MKITLELPNWVNEDSVITILSGQELVAVKYGSDAWLIKSARCNQCGECCLEIPESYLPFGTNGEGKCNMLKGGKCTAGVQKPFACLGDPPLSAMKELGCSIRYK